MKIYSKKQLKLIAESLNTLIQNSNKTDGALMNSYHLSRFQSKSHCLDYHEGAKKIKVYLKDKEYPSMLNDEVFLGANPIDNYGLMIDSIKKAHYEILKERKK